MANYSCEGCRDNGCGNCSPGEADDTLSFQNILRRLIIKWILEQHQDDLVPLKESDISEQDIKNNIVEGVGAYGSEEKLLGSLVEYYSLGYKPVKDEPTSTGDLLVFKQLVQAQLTKDMSHETSKQYGEILDRINTNLAKRFA